MTTVELGNIKLEIDRNATEKFYKSQNGFICDCPDCLNYVSKISGVLSELNGLEKQLGIDLTKAVGQGMDELMPHDYDDYHLYVIPYYLIGKCFINENELQKQSIEPIWEKTKKAEYKLTENLSLRIIETNKYVEIENAENILTIWLEYKTELIEK
ncbi:hypothetical protein Q2T41_18055 [Maribacter confluentis]|uniref:Competence protein ComFB n=1 Tax=Maribacter confluentis TaxID=1656093 RepID=A0ABT8RW67_9FLAO|nr:hypothetical protein [Maribacter confluentis]MDO1514562.1 hypothetical protein [Maribacter confluentis]